MTSTIKATHTLHAAHPIIRVSATKIYVYQLRNSKKLYTFVKEVSARLRQEDLTSSVQHLYGGAAELSLREAHKQKQRGHLLQEV